MRRYLLGELAPAEQQQLEERLLLDDEAFEELLIVEDELIDEYVRQALTPAEQERCENFFLLPAERQEKLRFAVALGRYVAQHTEQAAPAAVSAAAAPQSSWFGWLRPFFASPLGAVVMTVLVLACAFGGWRVLFHQSEVSQGLLALNNAYRAQRPTEARITGFTYAPLPRLRGAAPGSIDETARAHAERILRDAVQDEPGPAAHHALGQFYLAERKFDQAIEEFTTALKDDPANAQLYSDLGAAYMERGQAAGPEQDANHGPEDLARALEACAHALELDPALLAARYNRALCHEALLLPQQATEDWREYLRRDTDPNSQWAVEARQHLTALTESGARAAPAQANTLEHFLAAYRAGDEDGAWKIYARSHTSTGNTITGALLDAALRTDAGDHAPENTRALVYLGELAQRRVRDAYTSDLARVYLGASPPQRTSLAAARALVKSGYALFAQSKLSDALNTFATARMEFAAAGDAPEALVVDYAMAHAATLQPDIERARALFARLVPVCEQKSYRWLLAQSLSERAHLLLNLDQYSDALADGTRALDLLAEVEDQNGMLGSLVQLASIHRSLNDSERSLLFLRRGLTLAREVGSAPLDTWGVYIAASLNFNALSLYRAALDYQQEALRLALDTQRPLLISRSYQYLGLTYGNLRRYDEAINNVRRAYDEGAALAGERNGQNMMANAALKLGDLYRLAGEQTRAQAAYAESIQLYDQLDFPHYSYAAHKGRLLSYIAAEEDAAAAQELPVVLQLFAGYRARIREERRRDLFFDNEQDIYDLAIDFAYTRQHDPRRAFDYSESSRARSLLDLLNHGGAEVADDGGGSDLRLRGDTAPLSLREIQARLPERTQILQYAVLKDKLLIWLITKSDVVTRAVDLDGAKLAAAVAAGRKQALTGERDAAGDLKTLYTSLIKPLADALDRDKLLCIVPDKELNYLPFAALVSDTSGRYLLEDYRLSVAPSATIFLNCTETARARGGALAEHLLIVGNPSFDRQAYPQLPDLTDAEREASRIAAYYQHPRVLVRAQARVAFVRTELERADVAHFAAHYVIDPRSNLSSQLLLAATTGGAAHGPADEAAQRQRDDGLAAREVYQLRLARTRLVVLSACQTGIEQQYRGEGPISFARPFIVAGVPLVVASLWPVASAETATLMIAFHRYRKGDGLPTVEALRRAQLEMLASNDPRLNRPACWASFVPIGGYAEF
jgi:CHAT domain-containing protein/tetratricopeptide (TPR) repeat protein